MMIVEPIEDVRESSSRDDLSDQTRSIPPPVTTNDEHRDPITDQQCGLLLSLLGDEGILIVKHGRQGSPKSRVLRFSSNSGDPYLSWGTSATKRLHLRDVLSVRKGDDPDPTQTRADTVGSEETSCSCVLVQGTKNLRRTAKLQELSLCVSLILADRTFDIQCSTHSQCDQLYEALKASHPALWVTSRNSNSNETTT